MENQDTENDNVTAIEINDGDEFVFMDETSLLPMVCCDCGLTHMLSTRVENDKVVMTVEVDREVTDRIRSEAAVISNEFGEWSDKPPAIEGWWWMSVLASEGYKQEAFYVYPASEKFYFKLGEVTEVTANLGAMWCPCVQPPSRNGEEI